ncbi:MAG: hypothetical protein RLN60_02205 [Phycisphaerales bacterium]
MSMDVLVTALLDLAHELPDLPKPLLVGGGFGLYLKQRHLEEKEDLDTLIAGELWPPARATEDVDLLLPTEVIISVEHMRAIRAALDTLGYRPDVPNFQFVKDTKRGPVKIDLLTGDVPDEHADKVHVKPPRVRPVGDVALHAYLAREAIELGLAPFEFTLRGVRSDDTPAGLTVRIPNSFTYLLMKLHAFRDRVDDERKDLGAHHALDVYRIIAMLNREEYDLVKRLAEDHAASDAVRDARAIVSNSFGSSSSVGVLRLLAGAEDAGLSRSAVQVDEFVSVLSELFPITKSEVSQR